MTMGEAELSNRTGELIIRSVLIFYGDAANADLAESLGLDVMQFWNQPQASVIIKNKTY